jgi:3-oxoacyl-[acyl-carrier-protein] synthase III
MKILGIARAIPSHEVSNHDLVERIMGHQANAIPSCDRPRFAQELNERFTRAGAVTRFHRAAGEFAVTLGIEAGRRALDRAGLTAQDIDLLIYVGVGRGFLEPATANIFQHKLGLTSATCFDILDACASWVRALDVAHHLLERGVYRHVMILNCECNFEEFIRWDFRTLADLEHLWGGFTVGEAATATILGPGGDDYHATFVTRGEHYELCQIPLRNVQQFMNGTKPRCDAPPLHFFVYAAELHQQAIAQLDRQFWSDPALAEGDWDLIVGHSTSVPAAHSVVRKLRLDPLRTLETFSRFGNTVSASIPLGLSLALERGRLERGDRVLLISASAGLTTGFVSFRY